MNYIKKRKCFCCISINRMPSSILHNFINAFTFEGWYPVIAAQTLNTTSIKSNIHFLISDFKHSPVIFVSERAYMTIGIDFFKGAIINTISLYKFHSPSCSTKNPLGHCTDFVNTFHWQLTYNHQKLFFQTVNHFHQIILFWPFKRQSHKMVKHTQTICRQFANELRAGVWPFCDVGA